MKRLAIPLCLLLTVVAAYAPPTWWSQGSTNIYVTGAAANNYGPVNLGQLKHVATQAKKHLDLALPASGGAGPEVSAMVAAFTSDPGTPTSPGTNFSPVNLGQLKAVALPFYNRLRAIGYNTRANLIAHGYSEDWIFDYPWDPATPASENFGPATIGQLKIVFSFEVPLDTDGDGMADSWETASGLNPLDGSDAHAWLLGDGRTAAQIFASGETISASAPAWQAVRRVLLTQTVLADGTYQFAWTIPSGLSGQVAVQRELADDLWVSVCTANVIAGGVTAPAPVWDDVQIGRAFNGTGPGLAGTFNHRLNGAVTSNESVQQLRLMMKTSRVARGQPGYQEFEGSWRSQPASPERRYYKKATNTETWSYAGEHGTKTQEWLIDPLTRTAKWATDSSGGSYSRTSTSDWTAWDWVNILYPWQGTISYTSEGGYESDQSHWSLYSSYRRDTHRTRSTGGDVISPFTWALEVGPPTRSYGSNGAGNSQSGSWMNTESWTDSDGGGGSSTESGSGFAHEFPWFDGYSETGPTQEAVSWSGDDDSYSMNLQLSQEYTFSAFFADTLPYLPPFLSSRGYFSTSHAGEENAWRWSEYDEFPKRVEGHESSFFSGNPGSVLSSQRNVSADLGGIDLTKSEYWIVTIDVDTSHASRTP